MTTTKATMKECFRRDAIIRAVLAALRAKGCLTATEVQTIATSALDDVPHTRAEIREALQQLVTEGSCATERGDYWIARRSADYACETGGACLCSGDDDECDCQPETREVERTVCLACSAAMAEFEADDHRVMRPFEGRILERPQRPQSPRRVA